jgi:hypothetical protein
MKLDPAEYSCPDHHIDLTGQVTDALDEEDDRPPVAYPIWPLKGKPAGPRPFEVLVTCPGAPGRPQPHQLACTGTWAR